MLKNTQLLTDGFSNLTVSAKHRSNEISIGKKLNLNHKSKLLITHSQKHLAKKKKKHAVLSAIRKKVQMYDCLKPEEMHSCVCRIVRRSLLGKVKHKSSLLGNMQLQDTVPSFVPPMPFNIVLLTGLTNNFVLLVVLTPSSTLNF